MKSYTMLLSSQVVDLIAHVWKIASYLFLQVQKYANFGHHA